MGLGFWPTFQGPFSRPADGNIGARKPENFSNGDLSPEPLWFGLVGLSSFDPSLFSTHLADIGTGASYSSLCLLFRRGGGGRKISCLKLLSTFPSPHVPQKNLERPTWHSPPPLIFENVFPFSKYFLAFENIWYDIGMAVPFPIPTFPPPIRLAAGLSMMFFCLLSRTVCNKGGEPCCCHPRSRIFFARFLHGRVTGTTNCELRPCP